MDFFFNCIAYISVVVLQSRALGKKNNLTFVEPEKWKSWTLISSHVNEREWIMYDRVHSHREIIQI